MDCEPDLCIRYSQLLIALWKKNLKLIGSQIEQAIRKSLLFSRLDSAKENDIDPRVIEALNSCKPAWKVVYFLEHIPDQGEDFYTILCDKHSILRVEVDRIHTSKLPLVESAHIEEYRKGLRGKPHNLKLLIALELLDD